MSAGAGGDAAAEIRSGPDRVAALSFIDAWGGPTTGVGVRYDLLLDGADDQLKVRAHNGSTELLSLRPVMASVGLGGAARSYAAAAGVLNVSGELTVRAYPPHLVSA